MKTVKVKTPAKINMTLEILGKRPDGFHNIQSIMQAISIFDCLKISVGKNSNDENTIKLSGNNKNIPYDNTNLVWIAAEKFFEKSDMSGFNVDIYLEKTIPVAAGLAGGSSNAAGTLFGLNEIFDKPLSLEQLDEIAATIGSDVNFCLHGATQLATSRGEILESLSTPELSIVLVKPKDVSISAKEAYQKYAKLHEEFKNSAKVTNEMKDKFKVELMNNDLETAILPDYEIIKDVKNKLIEQGALNAMMSGSGPSVFAVYEDEIDLSCFGDEYDVFNAKTIKNGVFISG